MNDDNDDGDSVFPFNSTVLFVYTALKAVEKSLVGFWEKIDIRLKLTGIVVSNISCPVHFVWGKTSS